MFNHPVCFCSQCNVWSRCCRDDAASAEVLQLALCLHDCCSFSQSGIMWFPHLNLCSAQTNSPDWANVTTWLIDDEQLLGGAWLVWFRLPAVSGLLGFGSPSPVSHSETLSDRMRHNLNSRPAVAFKLTSSRSNMSSAKKLFTVCKIWKYCKIW